MSRSFSHTPQTTYFWAIASLLPLPAALLVLPSFGVSAMASFGLGVLGVLTVLAMNALLEKRLWMQHDEWHEVFLRPDASLRLAVFAGAILLIVETAAMMYILLSSGADQALLEYILGRQCGQPQGVFIDVCERLAL